MATDGKETTKKECIYCEHFFECDKKSAKVQGCINYKPDRQEKV